MLLVNQIVESVQAQEPFEKPSRILWLRRERDLVTFITLGETLKAPWSMSLQEAESMLGAGKLRLTSVRTPAFMLQLDEDLKEKEKEVRERRWNVIKGLFDGPEKDLIYYPGALGQLVANHAEKTGKPPKTIYRLLYLYWAFGMTSNAFLPKYENSGARGKAREFANGKKPGRRPRFLGEVIPSSTKLLNDDDKDVIKVCFALYKENKVKHISDAYVKMLNRYYLAEHPAPDGSDDERCLKWLDEIPSERQFGYWGKKAFDDIDIMRGRKGKRRWDLDHRPLVGTSYQGLRGPCHRFEIDATIADIYLVSRFNRNWIIGRPIVYVVVDVFSRMIVGLHVALEGPSWNSARHALFNAFTDKVAYCATYGITIQPEDWPCCHLPHELVGDRGEMISNTPESMANDLKITLDILPPFRGD